MTTAAHDRIAAIISADRVTTAESLLDAVVSSVHASGARVVGLLAETPDLRDGACGVGILKDIASGKSFSIRLKTAPIHTACQLDVAGVAAACQQLQSQIATSDLVVLSKFGKLEAMRSGLAAAFEATVAARIPLLTSVANKYHDAWKAFAPDAADLAPEKAVLLAWWRASARGRSLTTPFCGRG